MIRFRHATHKNNQNNDGFSIFEEQITRGNKKNSKREGELLRTRDYSNSIASGAFVINAIDDGGVDQQ